MKIKSYFAETVSEAVKLARREMGEEAVLIETRRSPAGSEHLGAYEVVFANTGAPAAAPKPAPAPALPPSDMARLTAEMAQMRRQLDSIRLALRSGLAAPRWLAPSSALSEVFSSLLAADLSADVAQSIVDRVHARLDPARLEDADALRHALAAELESRVAVDPTLGRAADAGPRVAALVGPPGAGKTTTLVKLAVAHGLAARKSVALLSLDNLRVGGADQLRSYAAILGVAFQSLETPASLGQAIEDHQAKSLILLDTPGYAPGEMDCAAELAAAFTIRPDIDVHLVLTASMKPADLSRVVEAFEVFRPVKLLFTRLDETDSFGPIYAEAARTGKPLSFFGTGQRIPEELAPASRDLLLDLILRGQPDRQRQAA